MLVWGLNELTHIGLSKKNYYYYPLKVIRKMCFQRMNSFRNTQNRYEQSDMHLCVMEKFFTNQESPYPLTLTASKFLIDEQGIGSSKSVG